MSEKNNLNNQLNENVIEENLTDIDSQKNQNNTQNDSIINPPQEQKEPAHILEKLSPEEIQKQRAVNVNRKLAEIIASKGLEGYFEQRWMLKFIFDIGGPIIYDQQLIKFIIAFIISIASMFFIGTLGFLLLILLVSGVIIWDLYERFKNSGELIRELGGHDKTNEFLNTFITSPFTEGMSNKKFEQFKNHIRRYDELLATYHAVDKNEKNIQIAHEKKADIFKLLRKSHKAQPYMVILFCLHIYKSNGEKFLHLRNP